jgi:sugar phosphate isomerase/epimerase
MKIVLFTKMLSDLGIGELAALGQTLELDGYDLCVREGQPVTPENVERELPRVADALKRSGTPVRMISGPGFPMDPENTDSRRIVAAMAEAGIKYYKLGYARLDEMEGGYARKMHHCRDMLQRWQKIAEAHDLQLCCHTYGGGGPFGYYAAHNAAALYHIMEGTDPRYIRAYLDPGLMLLSGEPHPLALEILRDRVSLIGLQEVLVGREAAADEGRIKPRWVPAGEGSVPWSGVFQTLRQMQFDGLLVVHAEFEASDPAAYRRLLAREIAYFRQKRADA